MNGAGGADGQLLRHDAARQAGEGAALALGERGGRPILGHELRQACARQGLTQCERK